jgi:hypothetical protein
MLTLQSYTDLSPEPRAHTEGSEFALPFAALRLQGRVERGRRNENETARCLVMRLAIHLRCKRAVRRPREVRRILSFRMYQIHVRPRQQLTLPDFTRARGLLCGDDR